MRLCAGLLGSLLMGTCAAQDAPAATTKNDPLAALTPAQKDSFLAAGKDFAAEQYGPALATLKPLVAQLPPGSPAQGMLAKYAAEAALNTGDRAYALGLLKPIEAADAYDWQAKSLLARADAEAGDKPARDAELASLTRMHKEMPSAQIGKLTQILLERDVLANGGTIRIWYSLEPWGRYKTYLFSRVFDKAGQQTLRIALESSDFDQPMFVKEHPEQAARGDRRFSLDGYGQDVKAANGGVTQTHMTFGFFDGRPPYDTVRARMLTIAEGKGAPISSSSPGTGVKP